MNLKVLTSDFEWFSSKILCEVEIKTVSNFSHFLSSPTVTSQVLFPAVIEGLPGVLGNKGTKRKYRREQRNMSPVLGNTGT